MTLMSSCTAGAALLVVTGCGSDVVDPDATGISLAVVRPESMSIDQIEVAGTRAGQPLFSAMRAPKTPRQFGFEEDVVILVPKSWDGYQVQLQVDGLAAAQRVLSGRTDALIELSTLCTATVALSACGDGECTAGENHCTCQNDCPKECGDGCCEPSESPQSCPDDCN